MKRKKRKGIHELTDAELQDKSQQQAHTEIKGSYWIQTTAGIRILDPAKYTSLEKLAAYKAKWPGCYMKNNFNNMQKTFNNL